MPHKQHNSHNRILRKRQPPPGWLCRHAPAKTRPRRAMWTRSCFFVQENLDTIYHKYLTKTKTRPRRTNINRTFIENNEMEQRKPIQGEKKPSEHRYCTSRLAGSQPAILVRVSGGEHCAAAVSKAMRMGNYKRFGDDNLWNFMKSYGKTGLMTVGKEPRHLRQKKRKIHVDGEMRYLRGRRTCKQTPAKWNICAFNLITIPMESSFNLSLTCEINRHA